ncbi:single-stranded-DNA-specific exonuclease RecJ [Lentilactobacillus sp. Marseille-Q4993]|uniref:single-stranded-DNA-specific exonuclease RecJ n=1 Tax=Lentilactobacillus sp. Marseille-Q4993 TaxID=3039492 RepID=UPI0024BD3C0B|nr:single-stranded-DNA-specific exonuclease RecJ [Lentilactobacillus sp. Marseille-Q4993]
MINSKYDWQLNNVDQTKVDQFSKSLNVSELVAKLLLERGISDPAAAKTFLEPSIENLHNPFELHDMQKAIDRIQTAVGSGEKITVYGDYDADGITSTTIMYEVLTDLGAYVDYYIPNRFTDGYGPNQAAFGRIIDAGTTLIITVDNGVAGNDSIDLANSKGCDVVVTDHHDLPDELPNAFAIVHPMVTEGMKNPYPFTGLSGAGVAFKVATALLEEIPYELMDVAAIGTVADVVSLTDENRILVKYGIEAIKNTQRPGLSALIKKAGVEVNDFNEQDIGFCVAPRLNSLGRIDDASVGVKLLTTFDEEEDGKLAEFANSQNDLRKSLVDQFFDEAQKMVEKDASILARKVTVIVGNEWHQGVLGIVASRLVDKYQKPAIVLTTLPGTDDLKGSGRSIDSFDLFKAIVPVAGKMEGFGGHHSAVGLTVKQKNLKALINQLELAGVEQKLDDSYKQELSIAAKLPVSEVNDQLFADIRTLAPFGQDNPEPIFEFSYDKLVGIKQIGKNNDHLRFNLANNGMSMQAIAFQMGNLADQLENKTTETDIIGELGTNTWKGKTNFQIMVEDLRQELPAVVDLRTNSLHKSMFSRPGVYLFFHQKTMNQLESFISEGTPILFKDYLSTDTNTGDTLFVVDCPDKVDDLVSALKVRKPASTVFYLYKKQLVSKLGMPDRVTYAKLFKFISENPGISLSNQMGQLAKHIGTAQNSLVFMIKVFAELEFISVDNGVVNLKPGYTAKDLASAPAYKLRERQIDTEQKLLIPGTNELVSFVDNVVND